MASFKKHCEQCGAYYDAYLDRSRFCSAPCRVRANREKQVKRLKLARQLLDEQTALIESGADLSTIVAHHQRSVALHRELDD